MSRIAKLYPTRIYRTLYDPVIENASNMFTGVDSDTYASVTASRTDSLFLGGFDFSLVPSSAIISSFSIKLRLGRETSNASTSGRSWINDGTNVVPVANSSTISASSTPKVSVIDPTPLSFDDLRAYGDDFNLWVYTLVNDTTRVYGAEIDVEYDLPKNKVVYFGQTLIDLTADTVTAERLTKGFTAHDASGALITGVATEGSTYQDEDGCVVLGEDESSAPQGNISITANGIYDVAQYAGASVEVPVGMTETDLKSFIQRNATFTDIDWPDGLTRIGEYAFADCYYFNTSDLPSGVTSISQHAFRDCQRLTLTSLPSGVTYIGMYAFYACYQLALTSLPSGVTYIGDYAFYGCSRITLTGLPSGVTSIGNSSFRNCPSITLTSLPSGVTSIGIYAFYGCSAIAIMRLPDSITSIGGNAFQNCSSLTSVSCEGVVTSLGSSVFLGSSTQPMVLASASFPNMALTSPITAVFGSGTAANACQQLAFCDIGSTTGIAANAFANCYALETLVLRKTDAVCALANVNAFSNTPMRGYDGKTGKVYVPSALIESYKTASNWSTLYNDGAVEFLAIEGSDYER